MRRLTLFIEQSLAASLQTTVFEPNGPAQWRNVQAIVNDFLAGLFHEGRLKGDTPSEAYFVKCGPETMTQSDVDNGDLNVVVGFAPLKPAEFVVVAIAAFAAPPGPDIERLPHALEVVAVEAVVLDPHPSGDRARNARSVGEKV